MTNSPALCRQAPLSLTLMLPTRPYALHEIFQKSSALIKVKLPDEPLDYLELEDVIQIRISAVGNHEKCLERIRGVNFQQKDNSTWQWDQGPSGRPLPMNLVNSILDQILNELGYKDVSNVALFQPSQLTVKERHCFERVQSDRR